MQINGRKIGPGHAPYIVAEISCNHVGKIEYAFRLIEAANQAGADAVKFQAYTPDTITIDCDKPDFIVKDGPWKGRKLYELYQKAHTPLEWIPPLFAHAHNVGITIFASVFDETSVDALERVGCPAYKIASMEITDIPLIKYAAKTGRPLIISTGMSTWKEIEDAAAASKAILKNTAFLHCVSGYPTPTEEANLKRMRQIDNWLWRDAIMGISDHTTGLEIPIAATAMGASIIEKHLTLDANIDSEDRTFSLLPHEFEDMVYTVRRTYAAMQPSIAKSEQSSRQLRRSLYVTQDMKKGDLFTKDNVRSIRPGYGLPPSVIGNVIGRPAQRNIERGSPLTIDDVSETEWNKMWAKPFWEKTNDD